MGGAIVGWVRLGEMDSFSRRDIDPCMEWRWRVAPDQRMAVARMLACRTLPHALFRSKGADDQGAVGVA